MKFHLLFLLTAAWFAVILTGCLNSGDSSDVAVDGTVLDAQGMRISSAVIAISYNPGALPAEPKGVPASKLISFSLDSESQVAIVISNRITEDVVRTFSPAAFEAGEHTVVWDLRDDENRLVISGFYTFSIIIDGAESQGPVQFINIDDYRSFAVDDIQSITRTNAEGLFSIRFPQLAIGNEALADIPEDTISTNQIRLWVLHPELGIIETSQVFIDVESFETEKVTVRYPSN